MPVCAVPTCATTHRAVDKTLYKFPKDTNYARIWVRCCMKKDSFNTKSAFICSLHFSDEAYQRDINHDILGYSSKRNLRKDAVPTLQLPSLRMLRKNSIESLKSEGVSLLLDAIPSLSPKSSIKDTELDMFSCPRIHKFHVKFYHSMKYRTNSISSVHCSDTSFDSSAQKDDVSAECALEKENSDAHVDDKNSVELVKHVV